MPGKPRRTNCSPCDEYTEREPEVKVESPAGYLYHLADCVVKRSEPIIREASVPSGDDTGTCHSYNPMKNQPAFRGSTKNDIADIERTRRLYYYRVTVFNKGRHALTARDKLEGIPLFKYFFGNPIEIFLADVIHILILFLLRQACQYGYLFLDLDLVHLNLVVGSPKRIHVRRISISVVAALAFAVASPRVRGFPLKRSDISCLFMMR